MRIIGFIVILIVLLVLVAGCTNPGNKPVPATPAPVTPTVVPAPVSTVTPQLSTDYLSYLSKGNTEVLAGKSDVQKGRTLMLQALERQGNVAVARPLLSEAAADFTSAQQHFATAMTDYQKAQVTAPAGMQDTLTTMVSTLNGCVTSCTSFNAAVNLATSGDWYAANEAFNKAASSYDVSMNTINPLLTLLDISS